MYKFHSLICMLVCTNMCLCLKSSIEKEIFFQCDSNNVLFFFLNKNQQTKFQTPPFKQVDLMSCQCLSKGRDNIHTKLIPSCKRHLFKLLATQVIKKHLILKASFLQVIQFLYVEWSGKSSLSSIFPNYRQ